MKDVVWLVARPHKDLEPIQLKPTLENMQEIVGGWIEFVYPFEFNNGVTEVFCICNEEGKLLGLEPNRPILDENGEVVDILHGTFLIGCSKAGDDRDEYEDIPFDFLLNLLEQPTWFHSCYFIFVNGKIRAVPEKEEGRDIMEEIK